MGVDKSQGPQRGKGRAWVSLLSRGVEATGNWKLDEEAAAATLGRPSCHGLQIPRNRPHGLSGAADKLDSI